MPTAIVKLKDRTNRVINIVKAKYDLNDKSQAIDRLAEEYEELILEPAMRPEYIEKLKQIEKEKSIPVRDVDAYFSRLKK